MNTKQYDRIQINLRLKPYLLELIDEYCERKGFIRNKFIERLIEEKFKDEIRKIKR